MTGVGFNLMSAPAGEILNQFYGPAAWEEPRQVNDAGVCLNIITCIDRISSWVLLLWIYINRIH